MEAAASALSAGRRTRARTKPPGAHTFRECTLNGVALSPPLSTRSNMARPWLSIFLLLASGCATAGEPAPAPGRSTTDVSSVIDGTNTRIVRYADGAPEPIAVDAPADQVFAVLPDAYRAVGIEMAHNVPATRTSGNRQVVISRQLGNTPVSQYLRCGTTPVGTPSADSYRIRMSVLTTVEPAAAGSTVRTQILATATPPGRNDELECTTTGRLESVIANAIQMRLAGK